MSNPPQYPQGPNEGSGQSFGQGAPEQGTPQYQGSPQYQGNFQPAGTEYPAGGPAPAPQPPKEKGLLAKLLPVLVIIALIVGFRIFGGQLFGGGLKEGSCVTLTKKGALDYDDKKASCDDDSSFTVVKKGKSKDDCGKNYSTYTVRANKKTTYYCLMENYKEGKCYKASSGQNPAREVVACGAGADFKIAKRVDGKADESQCSGRQQAAVFDMDPKRTYCLAAPN